MAKKIEILFIAMLMFVSNVAFSATSVYSFISESNFVNSKENKVDIVKQCRGIVNMPKVFCDLCVELTEEIIQSTGKSENDGSIDIEYDYNDIIGNFEAVENNNKKQKFVGLNSKEHNPFITNDESRFVYTARERCIFYIIRYIGLLRANDVVNNIILAKNICFETLFVV